MAELVIKIPEKEFGIELNDKFQDFFNRLKAEIKTHCVSNENLVCGAYELETIDMFLKAFANSISLPKEYGKLIDADKEIQNLCDSCINNSCIFQSGIVRNHCDFYKSQQDHNEEVAKAFQLGISFGFIDGLANKTQESEE